MESLQSQWDLKGCFDICLIRTTKTSDTAVSVPFEIRNEYLSGTTKKSHFLNSFYNFISLKSQFFYSVATLY
jgi:hypothetical protein